MEQTFNCRSRSLVGLTIAATIGLLVVVGITRHSLAQERSNASTMVVRIAFFPAEVPARDHREWIEDHLFPTLRTVPGYFGTYIGRDTERGQLLSLSFWENGAAVLAGEEAVGRVVRSQPIGVVPRPSKVEKYLVQYRDVKALF